MTNGCRCIVENDPDVADLASSICPKHGDPDEMLAAMLDWKRLAGNADERARGLANWGKKKAALASQFQSLYANAIVSMERFREQAKVGDRIRREQGDYYRGLLLQDHAVWMGAPTSSAPMCSHLLAPDQVTTLRAALCGERHKDWRPLGEFAIPSALPPCSACLERALSSTSTAKEAT